MEVALGGAVELAPAPGEELSRIARVEALWAEDAGAGRQRMLARVQRYYRPAVRAHVWEGRGGHA